MSGCGWSGAVYYEEQCVTELEVHIEMNKEKLNIIHLPKEQWQNVPIPMRYTTDEYYDVKIRKENSSFRVDLVKEKLEEPISHYPEESDFPDKLYQEHWEKAYAWGIVEETDGKQELVACIETCPEEWSNRLMVTELWVHERLRRKGIGHALMAIAKQQANLEHRRAVILETQSCNVPAIRFYLQEGFELIGFDSCCYSNRDIERKEVRLDLGYFPRKKKVNIKEVIIREESQEEYHEVEEVALRAFWNKHRLGCNEHLLVHKIRTCEDYVPEISRIAEVNGEIVGAIYYTKAQLQNGDQTKEILTFGPLCVLPEWQGCGIGRILLEETLKLAKQQGYEGAVIFGEPDYYPLLGFKTCDHFGITTLDGKNYDAFLGIELVEDGLSRFGGKFIEPKVFEELSEKENEELTNDFRTPKKQKFPSQWT